MPQPNYLLCQRLDIKILSARARHSHFPFALVRVRRLCHFLRVARDDNVDDGGNE